MAQTTALSPAFSPAKSGKGPLGIPYGWWLVVVVLYLVSPLDVLPDFLPVVGWVDDTGLLGFGAFCLFKWFAARRAGRVAPATA